MQADPDLLDVLAFSAGLGLIVWAALHSLWHKVATALPPAAMLGMMAWLAVFGVALYLIFG